MTLPGVVAGLVLLRHPHVPLGVDRVVVAPVGRPATKPTPREDVGMAQDLASPPCSRRTRCRRSRRAPCRSRAGSRALHALRHVVDLRLPELQVERVELPLAHARRRAGVEIERRGTRTRPARSARRTFSRRHVLRERRPAVDGHEHRVLLAPGRSWTGNWICRAASSGRRRPCR